MKYLGLCAIVKDEDPFLEEWICFHALLGVEAFIIYDNESSVPVRRRLRPFMRGSFLTILELPGKNQQIFAYNHCLKNFAHNFHWLGFLDLDEYVVPKQVNDLRVLLQDYEYAAALGLNWVCFGTGGHKARPTRPQIESYTLALQNEHWATHVKSFVHPGRVSGIWNPHFATLREDGCTVNEKHTPFAGPFSPFSAEHAQINHYYYRSYQDYYNKLLRGRADNIPRNIPRKISPPEGDASDTSALRFAPALQAALERSDTASHLAERAAYFCRKRTRGQAMDEICSLLTQDRPEEALALLGHATARDPDPDFHEAARCMIKAALTHAA